MKIGLQVTIQPVKPHTSYRGVATTAGIFNVDRLFNESRPVALAFLKNRGFNYLTTNSLEPVFGLSYEMAMINSISDDSGMFTGVVSNIEGDLVEFGPVMLEKQKEAAYPETITSSDMRINRI